MHDSLNNEDLLDILFEPEEIDSVLKKLKLGKAAGHDGIQAEHIKYGGPKLDSANLQRNHRAGMYPRLSQNRNHQTGIQRWRERSSRHKQAQRKYSYISVY